MWSTADEILTHIDERQSAKVRIASSNGFVQMTISLPFIVFNRIVFVGFFFIIRLREP